MNGMEDGGWGVCGCHSYRDSSRNVVDRRTSLLVSRVTEVHEKVLIKTFCWADEPIQEEWPKIDAF